MIINSDNAVIANILDPVGSREMDTEQTITGDDVEDMLSWADHFQNRATYGSLEDALKAWALKAQKMSSQIRRLTLDRDDLRKRLEECQAIRSAYEEQT